MINELMKRLSKLPNVTLSNGQEYIQLYDAMETVKRALEQEPCEVEAAQLQQVYIKGFEDCRQAVLASIKNLYPDMPIVDIFGARRKWLEKYAPYFECENAVEQLPSVKPQEPNITWVTGADGAKIAFKDVPVGKVTKICEILAIRQERSEE